MRSPDGAGAGPGRDATGTGAGRNSTETGTGRDGPGRPHAKSGPGEPGSGAAAAEGGPVGTGPVEAATPTYAPLCPPTRREAASAAIRLRPRAALVIAMAAFLGLVAFFWPFVVAPGTFGSNYAPPLIFGVLLVLVLCVVLSEIAEGGIDSKALAMLGVLSAVNAALRPLGAGTAGIETVFFVLVLAGRVYGAGFGFVLGCTSLFASALITGGVGPWMPYQMFGCAFVGMLAGFLPKATGRREVVMLAVYGSLSGYLFGFLLNLSFWPFSLDPGSSIAYLPGLPFTEQWQRYLAFDIATSLGWDTGRAVTNLVCILLAGPAVLTVLRRAARRARFNAPVRFRPGGPSDTP